MDRFTRYRRMLGGGVASRMATAIVFVLVLSGLTLGQEYRFAIPEMTLNVYVQPDASARLEYKMVFENAQGAHVIDIVDVGLPHAGYRIANMQATIDELPVRQIRRSEYIDIGVECHLGSGSIPAGGTGTFVFSCVMPNMAYADTTNKEWASFQVRPTWYDRKYHKGKTKLRVAIHLPPGIKPEEIRYQQEKQRYAGLANFGEGDDQHAVAYWESDEHTLSADNPKFSISFPMSATAADGSKRLVMQRVVRKTQLQLLLEWFDANAGLKAASAALLMLIYMFGYYRFAGATGCVPFLLGAGLLALALVSGPGPHLLCWPAALTIVSLNEWFRSKKPRSKYLPAMATVEGGGIKRGLTAPQAAVLLEQPLGQVMTMVIFGLLKKEVITLLSEDPMTVEVKTEYRCVRKQRRVRAAKNGVVLHDYEQPFLDALQAHQGPVADCDLNESMGKLIKSVAERMKGFDRDRTREYYRRIVKRAWKDAGSIGEVKQRDKVVERNFEWMMMDPDWTDLFDIWRRRGYTYRPRWSRPVRIPTGSGRGSMPPTPSIPKPTAPSAGDSSGSGADAVRSGRGLYRVGGKYSRWFGT